MAKRKFKTRSVRRRASFTTTKSRKRSRPKMSGMFGNNGLIQPDAMAYGALREKMSTLLAPFTARIPFGSVADEAGLAVLNWFIAKKTNGFISSIASKGLVIENARIGEAIADGSAFTYMAKDKSTGQTLQATVF